MTNCPVCGSGRSRPSFAVTASEAAQHFVLREGNPERHAALRRHLVNLWGAEECVVRRCDECDFGYADPYVAGDATFYNLAYERAVYPNDKWEFQRTLQDFEATQFKGLRVLEVGAGFGFFLDKVVDKYVPRSGITALEFGDAAIATLKAKGYEAHQVDIRQTDLEPGFDAIFLFQVVEHMDGLDALFERIRELLTPHGGAYIAVPNPRRIDFNEENASLLNMPPNHIGRWSPTAFSCLAQRHGLRASATETEPFLLTQFVKHDIIYSYLRRAQISGTIANWSRAQRSGTAGKLLRAGVAVVSAVARAPVWVRAYQEHDLGGSLWVKLIREAQYS